jgi:membrane protein involved in colicin uptake
MPELCVTTSIVKIWLLALVLAGVGCHDASKDLQKLAETCAACDKDPKATPEAKKACATKAIDDLVAYIKAHPNPLGNEQNAADQFKALTTCAQKLGVDVNGKTKGL